MVYDIDGLNTTDVAILRFLNGHRFEHFEAPQKVVAKHIGSTTSTVNRRCQRLVAAGLIEETEEESSSGYHAITDLGKRFLRQDLDGEEVEAIEKRVQEFLENS